MAKEEPTDTIVALFDPAQTSAELASSHRKSAHAASDTTDISLHATFDRTSADAATIATTMGMPMVAIEDLLRTTGIASATSWSLHDDILVLCAASGPRLELRRIGRDALVRAVSPARITPAELRLIKQLIVGRSLAQAAEDDARSRETKRAHYRSITQKLGVASRSQLVAQVVTAIITGLTADARADDLPDGSASPRERSLLERVHPLGRHFTLPVTRSDDGPEHLGPAAHRLVDYGPLDGTPVLFHPPQAALGFDAASVEVLHRLNLRVCIVLRPGQLEPDAPSMSALAFLRATHDATASALAIMGAGSAHVMGVISGAPCAIAFAAREPASVRSLTLFGATLSPTRGGIGSLFRRSLLTLALQHDRPRRAFMEFMRLRLRDDVVARRFLSRIFGGSAADLKWLEMHGEHLRDVFVGSHRAVDADFRRLSTFDPAELANVQAPIAFVHGAEDALADPTLFQSHLHGPSPVTTIEGCGQIPHGRAWEACFEACAARWNDLDAQTRSGSGSNTRSGSGSNARSASNSRIRDASQAASQGLPLPKA